MATTRPGTPRQPTLAEEIDELELAGKVTAALQAEVESHGMARQGPTGQEPQEQHPGVTNTPKRSPKIGKTPSPVRVDKDGATWTLEDDDEGQEEQEESESGVNGDDLARGSTDSRAWSSFSTRPKSAPWRRRRPAAYSTRLSPATLR